MSQRTGDITGQGALIINLPAMLCNLVSLLPCIVEYIKAGVRFLFCFCFIRQILCAGEDFWAVRKDNIGNEWLSEFVYQIKTQNLYYCFFLETNKHKTRLKKNEIRVLQTNMSFKQILNWEISNLDQLGKNTDLIGWQTRWQMSSKSSSLCLNLNSSWLCDLQFLITVQLCFHNHSD